MLESGCANRQSLPLSQSAGDAGKPAESRRWSCMSRRHCLFFVLAFGTLLFLYNARNPDMSSNRSSSWLSHYNTVKWRIPYKRPGPSAAVSSSVTTTVSQNKSEPQTLAPYKSPGPYLVEYPYEYHFTINEPYKCEQQKPFLVLVVPVAPHNRAHRNIIRSTWGGESLDQDKVVQLFFLLGRQSGEGAEQLQEQLLQESKEHRDLIQSDFLDCYKNLTIKTMVMLEWLDAHCSATSYAMKIDSDMFLNVPKLISMLLNAPKTNYLTGLVAKGGVVLRDPKSKWYLPASIYPYPQYPRYALGLGYVFSLDLAKKLVGASRHVKAVYIEDVYLGLCMKHLNIPPTDPPKWGYFQVFPVRYSRCEYSQLIATTTDAGLDRVWVWNDFKKPGKYC
uniref:beta-1,3-galactosyltransferase 1 n=1 Tax=Semicossyphus pulcher TaxID=241346 RepID=UPI0037E99600